MGDHTRDLDHGAVRELAESFRGDDAARRQFGAHELGGMAGRREPRRPEVGGDLLDVGHTREHGRVGTRHHARQLLGPGVAQRARRPQRGPSAAVETRERACGGQRLERVGGRAGPAGEVGQIDEGFLGSGVVDPVEQRVAQPPHVPEPHPHGVDRRVGVPPRAGPADRPRRNASRFHRAVAA